MLFTKIFVMKKIEFILLVFVAINFFSCSKKNPSVNQNEIYSLIPQKTENVDFEKIENQKWHVTNERIAILLGYGFNEEPFLSQIKDFVKNEFGLSEDGGLAYFIEYPKDFKHRSYSSELFNIISEITNENNLKGILLLGAPENTHYALARIQDEWNMNVPFPIISVYSQDDILGIEASSDIVFDNAQNQNILTEAESVLISDAPELVKNLLLYMNSLNGSLEGTDITNHAIQLLNGKKIHRYTDPETGLISENHFVVE